MVARSGRAVDLSVALRTRKAALGAYLAMLKPLATMRRPPRSRRGPPGSGPPT